MLTDQQLSQLKSVLKQRYRELRKRIEASAHFGNEDALIKESASELSNYDNHPGDQGTELFERQKDIALNEQAEDELEEIERALEAMDEGSYGKCEVCGQTIAYERLEAVPVTRRCLAHAAETTVSENRPAEEDVLRPAYGQFEHDEDENQATLFDSEDAWQRVQRMGTSETSSDFADSEKSYEDMFVEEDEEQGYVEEVEGFIMTDMEGNNVDVNETHEKYEKLLDDHRVRPIYGHSGIIDVINDEEENQQ